MRESVVCTSAAFWGSCNSICVLASTLLSIEVDQLNFPIEQDAVTFFQILAIILHFSQPLSRIFKPQRLFDNLFASFGIEDQACLMALNCLKAIPRACLVLAIPGPEIIVNLRIWLGVSLFPLSSLCACLSTIDNIGGYLLGCSQGPMRIHCMLT